MINFQLVSTCFLEVVMSPITRDIALCCLCQCD